MVIKHFLMKVAFYFISLEKRNMSKNNEFI